MLLKLKLNSSNSIVIACCRRFQKLHFVRKRNFAWVMEFANAAEKCWAGSELITSSSSFYADSCMWKVPFSCISTFRPSWLIAHEQAAHQLGSEKHESAGKVERREFSHFLLFTFFENPQARKNYISASAVWIDAWTQLVRLDGGSQSHLCQFSFFTFAKLSKKFR